MQHSLQRYTDKTAIGLSVLCMIHCLALPLAILLLPTLADLPFADERFHLMLVIAVLPISLFAMSVGCKRHRKVNVMLWIIAGLSLLCAAVLFGEDHLGEIGEKALTMTGALMIGWGHIQNYRTCRSDCQHETGHTA